MDQAPTSEEVKQAFEKPKTHNKLLIPFIIVLILAIAGVGFGVYEYISCNNSQQETEVDKEEDRPQQEANQIYADFNSEKAESLLNKYAVWSWGGAQYAKEPMTDYYKEYITFRELGALPIKENRCEKGTGGILYEYSYDQANAVYQKLFGSSADMPKDEEARCGVPKYIDDNTVEGICGCGGTGPQVDTIYQRYSIDGDKLTIYAINIAGNEKGGYSHLFDVTQYEFVFKPDNGNIVLTAINKL